MLGTQSTFIPPGPPCCSSDSGNAKQEWLFTRKHQFPNRTHNLWIHKTTALAMMPFVLSSHFTRSCTSTCIHPHLHLHLHSPAPAFICPCIHLHLCVVQLCYIFRHSMHVCFCIPPGFVPTSSYARFLLPSFYLLIIHPLHSPT